MNILDNCIILLLVIGSFLAGMRIANKYHESIEAYQTYLLKLNAAEKGLAYVAPPVKPSPIGQEFINRLKENGRATQRVRSSKQSGEDGASA